METTRVFMLNGGTAMGAGISRLLEPASAFDILSANADDPAVEEKLLDFGPQVVLLIGVDSPWQLCDFTKLLEQRPSVRMVCVRPEFPEIDILELDRLGEATPQEFVELVRNANG